mmetsp:Transcript_17096/g.50954  ORF Transcript_17096/g.50954 Transcript_17096/m.50954 type:complete len:236 (-) Transcript_17096:369-1076(-)
MHVVIDPEGVIENTIPLAKNRTCACRKAYTIAWTKRTGDIQIDVAIPARTRGRRMLHRKPRRNGRVGQPCALHLLRVQNPLPNVEIVAILCPLLELLHGHQRALHLLRVNRPLLYIELIAFLCPLLLAVLVTRLTTDMLHNCALGDGQVAQLLREHQIQASASKLRQTERMRSIPWRIGTTSGRARRIASIHRHAPKLGEEVFHELVQRKLNAMPQCGSGMGHSAQTQRELLGHH